MCVTAQEVRGASLTAVVAGEFPIMQDRRHGRGQALDEIAIATATLRLRATTGDGAAVRSSSSSPTMARQSGGLPGLAVAASAALTPERARVGDLVRRSLEGARHRAR